VNKIDGVALKREMEGARRATGISGSSGEDGEEKRLLKACTRARNPYLLSVVRLALESAIRKGELVALRWGPLDLSRRIAHLPDTKDGEASTVPLPSTTVEVLPVLPRSRQFPCLTTEALNRPFARATHRATRQPPVGRNRARKVF